MAWASWCAKAEVDSGGFNLPAEDSSSNLNPTSAEASAPLKAPETPNQLERTIPSDPVLPVPPEPVQAALPELIPPPQEEPPLLPEVVRTVAVEIPVAADPVDFASSHRGDSPMLRNWKSFGYPAILAAALVTSPEIIRAAAPEKIDGPAPAKDLEEIKAALKEMGKDIRGLQNDFKLLFSDTKGSLEGLRKEVDQLRKELDAVRKGQSTVSGYGPAATKDLEELRKQLDQVQQTLNAIRGQLPTNTTSLRPAATTGRIRLVNDFDVATEVVVNGAGYLIEPGMTRELTLPAGSFVYRVPSAGIADQSRTLASGQTYTITVVPR